MKTAIEIAEKEIAELLSSPSDQTTYTQIFEVLERVNPIFEQKIIDAYIEGYCADGQNVDSRAYYNQTFETNKETLK